MDRRQFVIAGGSTVALGIASRAFGAEEQGTAKTTSTPAALANAKNRELAETAAACVKTGDICQQHCLELLSQGDKSMAKCATTVAAMLPMCRTLEALSIQGSPHLAEFARTCGKVCRDCEAACKVHASHHQACKDCMESCTRCAAACEKYSA
jgi:Cys-rich four helix bundle protein (predicted Tat secretion target)